MDEIYWKTRKGKIQKQKNKKNELSQGINY